MDKKDYRGCPFDELGTMGFVEKEETIIVNYGEFCTLFERFRKALGDTLYGGIWHDVIFQEKRKEFIPLLKEVAPEADGLSNNNPYTIVRWVLENASIIKQRLK